MCSKMQLSVVVPSNVFASFGSWDSAKPNMQHQVHCTLNEIKMWPNEDVRPYQLRKETFKHFELNLDGRPVSILVGDDPASIKQQILQNWMLFTPKNATE